MFMDQIVDKAIMFATMMHSGAAYFGLRRPLARAYTATVTAK